MAKVEIHQLMVDHITDQETVVEMGVYSVGDSERQAKEEVEELKENGREGVLGWWQQGVVIMINTMIKVELIEQKVKENRTMGVVERRVALDQAVVLAEEEVVVPRVQKVIISITVTTA